MTDELNTDNVEISEKTDNSMTDLQIYGINSSVVRLISKLRKYTLLTQIQITLVNKPHKVQPVMREIYQFEETKMVMEIREEFDMFYVYTNDKFVMKNLDTMREFFEQAVGFVTSNMQNVSNVLEESYVEILDTFSDKLQQLSMNVATKSVYDEHFKIT